MLSKRAPPWTLTVPIDVGMFKVRAFPTLANSDEHGPFGCCPLGHWFSKSIVAASVVPTAPESRSAYNRLLTSRDIVEPPYLLHGLLKESGWPLRVTMQASGQVLKSGVHASGEHATRAIP